MDPLHQLINELHECPGPQTDELNRAARSLDGRPLSDHPAGRPQRQRRRRTLQRARHLVAHALRAVWQTEHAA
jgi:hypothetical protein